MKIDRAGREESEEDTEAGSKEVGERKYIDKSSGAKLEKELFNR